MKRLHYLFRRMFRDSGSSEAGFHRAITRWHWHEVLISEKYRRMEQAKRERQQFFCRMKGGYITCRDEA